MGTFTLPTASTAKPQGFEVPGTELVSTQQHASVIEEIRKATRDAEQLVRGRDTQQLTQRLSGGSWSVAECLDHLTQTTRAFLPAMIEAISRAPRLQRNRALRTGILPELFIRNLKPPYRMRFKVLPQLTPESREYEETWNAFVESQSQLLEVLRSAAGLAIDQVRIKSPVYARISYNIYGAFRMLAAHQQRHVWQIEQILKKLEYKPASSVA